jgi:hypothetical protein
MERYLFRAMLIHKKTGIVKTKHFSGADITEAITKAKRYLISHYSISFVMTDISMKKVIMQFADRHEADADPCLTEE